MSIWSANVSFANGSLVVAGCAATELAKEFGTPSFILDEADFRARATEYKNELEKVFPNSTVYYAGKAFLCVELVRWLSELGLGVDVATGGELAVALAGKIPANRIQVHGNNKSIAEIKRAVEVGVGSIVIDSIIEIERIAKIAKELNKVQPVMIRLTPGIHAETSHAAIATAHEDVKFGLSISSGAAWDAVNEIRKYPALDLRGVHAHIGSQIFNLTGHIESAKVLIEFLARYRDEFGTELPELDLGGGFGISYLESDSPNSTATIMKTIHEVVTTSCAAASLNVPKISIEPGRALIGPSMFTLYEVGTTKEVNLENNKTRNYVSVDGGMSDNIRPSLYGAVYTARLANRTSTGATRDSRIVGKHCETGDILITEIDLPSDVVPGDLIAVAATGAYNRSMASNYNHVPRPPVIAVKDGKARVILRRETEADLLSLDV